MRKLLLLSLTALFLVGCQSEDTQTTDAGTAEDTDQSSEQQTAAAPEPAVEEAPAVESETEPAQPAATMAERLESAVTGEHRSEANRARDPYRNPVETLTFFGMQPDMTVVEVWPGGGWYTEVLAPALRDTGKLMLAAYDPEVPDQPEYRYRLAVAMDEKFAAEPEIYDQVEVIGYSLPGEQAMGPAGSADMVVTFRNAHGWVSNDLAATVMADAFRVLRPGGILGFVQHRAEDGTNPKETAQRGYVSEEAIIALAEEAGFELVDSSEINANPMDTRDHPEGVWTLPPSLRLGDEDREKYEAIGESDRMTLKFVKPQDPESISEDSYEGG